MKFQIGDRVRYRFYFPKISYSSYIGTIIEFDREHITVLWENETDEVHGYSRNELELVVDPNEILKNAL